MALRPGSILVLVLIVADFTMIALALMQYPAFFSQPHAVLVVLQTVSVLVVFGVAVVWIGRQRSPSWDAILATAAIFGLLGGIAEALNIAIENGIPLAIRTPVVPIGSMLAIFITWVIAGFRVGRTFRSVRAGLLSAVISAGICMLLAVTAGFIIEFFAARPDPTIVLTWGEFKRSGWTDPRAFSVANTLDSAFTHLLIAPAIAFVLGGFASFVAQSRSSK
jgi:hypothetical protein